MLAFLLFMQKHKYEIKNKTVQPPLKNEQTNKNNKADSNKNNTQNKNNKIAAENEKDTTEICI